MKNHLLKVSITLLCTSIFGQVGIGTNSIESGVILKIESKPNSSSSFHGGVLLPKFGLTDKSVYSPSTGTPLNGLLVYNTTKNTSVSEGYYYWDAPASSWDDIYNPIKNDICKYSNERTNVNFNSGTSFMDLFTNFVENENTILYNKIDDYTLRINKTGLYKVILNLDMWVSQLTQDQDVFGVGVYLNNNRVSSQLVVMTNETASPSGSMTQTLGKTVTFFITIPSGGGDLKARGYAIHGASDVFFKAPKTSSISIERVR